MIDDIAAAVTRESTGKSIHKAVAVLDLTRRGNIVMNLNRESCIVEDVQGEAFTGPLTDRKIYRLTLRLHEVHTYHNIITAKFEAVEICVGNNSHADLNAT